MSTYHKDPVHEIVAALPTDKSAGYSCILTTDNSLNTLNSNGDWIKDTERAPGSQAMVIGINGDENNIATFLNAKTVALKRSPFFITGNLQNVAFAVFSGNNLYVIRKNAANTASDVILFKENGDTVLSSQYASNFIKAVTDSYGNVWVATAAHGLYKFQAGENELNPTHYCVANNNLPWDTISDIHADGNQLWIVYAAAKVFSIAKYDGYEFTDLSADLESDIPAVDCDDLTAVHFSGIYHDADRVMLAMDDATFSHRMFYYEKETGTFYAKALPTAYAAYYVVKFLKLGNNVYSIVNAAAAQSEGILAIWGWADGDVLVAGVTDLADLCTNGIKIYLWTNDTIQSISYPSNTIIDENTLETDIDALLTSPADLTIVGVAISSTGTLAFLNKDFNQNGDAINNIVGATPEAQWVISAR